MDDKTALTAVLSTLLGAPVRFRRFPYPNPDISEDYAAYRADPAMFKLAPPRGSKLFIASDRRGSLTFWAKGRDGWQEVDGVSDSDIRILARSKCSGRAERIPHRPGYGEEELGAEEALKEILDVILGPGEMTGGADWSVQRAYPVDPAVFGVQLTGGFDELFLILDDDGYVFLTARGEHEGEWILQDAGDVTVEDLHWLIESRCKRRRPRRGRVKRSEELNWEEALVEYGYDEDED